MLTFWVAKTNPSNLRVTMARSVIYNYNYRKVNALWGFKTLTIRYSHHSVKLESRTECFVLGMIV